jgi:hypothetical protein
VGADSGHISPSFKLRYWKSKRPISKKGVDKTPNPCYNTDTKKTKGNETNDYYYKEPH